MARNVYKASVGGAARLPRPWICDGQDADDIRSRVIFGV